MKKNSERKVSVQNIKGRTDSVSGILIQPADASVLLVLAHGAGAGMDHPFMSGLASRLANEGIATLRFQFPYWEDGAKRPDKPKLATATIAAAVQWAHDHGPDLSVFVGGKSFGGRMATTAAAMGLIPNVKGIVCYGFPLHQPKKPLIDRAEHLKDVQVPILFLQGTRDAMAELPLMTKVAHSLPLARMHKLEGADHAFEVLKRSGRTSADVLQELARETQGFCQSVNSVHV